MKLVVFLKKYYLMVVFISVICSGIIQYISNDYKIETKYFDRIVNGQIQPQEIIQIEQKQYYLGILSQILLNLGITLFITMYFVKYIDKNDKEQFEKSLREIQNKTAENAILSTFHQIIEPRFFSIIKNDVINCALIRDEAIWNYDITFTDDKKLKLVRTISYKLVNLSNEDQTETIGIFLQENCYSTSQVTQLRYKNECDSKFECVEISKVKIDGFANTKKDIIIKPNSKIDIIYVMEQVFSTAFIYETHSTRCPIVKLDLIVSYPSGYCFNLNAAGLSSPLELTLDTGSKKMWKINGAILKGQGIEFFCEESTEGEQVCGKT